MCISCSQHLPEFAIQPPVNQPFPSQPRAKQPFPRQPPARLLLTVAACVTFALPLAAQQAGQQPATPTELVHAMTANEHDDRAHQDRYEFLSVERSERTGGHLWTERVVEVAQGRLRLLLAMDGQPLSAARQQQERAKLDAILADPTAFDRQEAAQKNDESSARQMLDLLGRAFLFDNVRLQGGTWHVDFHPDPAFSSTGIEQRILTSMSGNLVIDARQLRLIHVEGSLPTDVSIGFGLLATIHAGSHFASDRRDLDGHWRTTHVLTDIRGKAALFKTLARNSDVTRSEFHYIDPNTSLAQAVALLKQSPTD